FIMGLQQSLHSLPQFGVATAFPLEENCAGADRLLDGSQKDGLDAIWINWHGTNLSTGHMTMRRSPRPLSKKMRIIGRPVTRYASMLVHRPISGVLGRP